MADQEIREKRQESHERNVQLSMKKVKRSMGNKDVFVFSFIRIWTTLLAMLIGPAMVKKSKTKQENL